MPYFGPTILEAYVNNKSVANDEKAKVLKCYFEKVNQLHEQEVLVVDIKPENAIFADDKAQIIDDATLVKIGESAYAVTLGFAAPELKVENNSCQYWELPSVASEIWACGRVLRDFFAQKVKSHNKTEWYFSNPVMMQLYLAMTTSIPSERISLSGAITFLETYLSQNKLGLFNPTTAGLIIKLFKYMPDQINNLDNIFSSPNSDTLIKTLVKAMNYLEWAKNRSWHKGGQAAIKRLVVNLLDPNNKDIDVIEAAKDSVMERKEEYYCANASFWSSIRKPSLSAKLNRTKRYKIFEEILFPSPKK